MNAFVGTYYLPVGVYHSKVGRRTEEFVIEAGRITHHAR